jgi:predicted nucleotidyltransferase
MTDTILENLATIERQHNVRILFAVESGSRAWGFASRDSDYDVRFIYLHPVEWYLSIREKRDVIECPISGDLDISGWDLRKALTLFRKSNPPLLEWLGSPIVYLDRYGVAGRLREMMATSFSPRRCIHHYLHMAQGNYREYLKGEMVRIKKYFYVLRPILACLWIERHRIPPPTEFARLYTDANLRPSLTSEIDRLLQRKIAGDELAKEAKIVMINDFLEQQIEYFSSCINGMATNEVEEEQLDDLFQMTLHEVWGSGGRRL